MKCKYNDCGWCYKWSDDASNADVGRCNEPSMCDAYEKDGDISASMEPVTVFDATAYTNSEWPDEQQSAEWISVNDSLPAEGGRYWCYVVEQTDLGKSAYQWNCYYSETEQRFNHHEGLVTHWRELMPPPEHQAADERRRFIDQAIIKAGQAGAECDVTFAGAIYDWLKDTGRLTAKD